MTNKDKNTEKLRELIGIKQIYRVHFTYGNEMRFICVVADRSELSSSENLIAFNKIESYVGKHIYITVSERGSTYPSEDYVDFEWQDDFQEPDDSVKDYRLRFVKIPIKNIEFIEEQARWER